MVQGIEQDISAGIMITGYPYYQRRAKKLRWYMEQSAAL